MNNVKFLFYSIILFCIINYFLYSQNLINNYPIKVGNVYVFTKVRFNSLPYLFDSVFIRCEVTRDTIVNSLTYYKIKNFPLVSDTNGFVRFDSSNGRFLMLNLPTNCNNYIGERLIDSLNASLNDSVRFCNNFLIKCIDTTSKYIFNNFLPCRVFGNSFGGGGTYTSTTKEYSDFFGLIRYYSGGSGSTGSSYVRYQLVGSVINGVLYGDITNYFIGLQIISTEMPRGFSLYDNYPNPFNPKTNIVFDISQKATVSITVFDVLGREVSILVNRQEIKSGKYKIDFDGSVLNSGMYFINMTAFSDNSRYFVQTRKMVLVK